MLFAQTYTARNLTSYDNHITINIHVNYRKLYFYFLKKNFVVLSRLSANMNNDDFLFFESFNSTK